ncbi:MAG: hypothetical protein AABZ00_05485 [Chloroflexota bacterium]
MPFVTESVIGWVGCDLLILTLIRKIQAVIKFTNLLYGSKIMALQITRVFFSEVNILIGGFSHGSKNWH